MQMLMDTPKDKAYKVCAQQSVQNEYAIYMYMYIYIYILHRTVSDIMNMVNK